MSSNGIRRVLFSESSPNLDDQELHPCQSETLVRVIKSQFENMIIRHLGLSKNAAHVAILFALSMN